MVNEACSTWSCFGGNKRFPTFAVILLVLSGLWLLNEIEVIKMEVPWIPIILIIVAISWIIDHYVKK